MDCMGQEKEAKELLAQAEQADPSYCFPNKLEDIIVLQFAVEKGCRTKATYYLGNLFYDKLQWEEAVALWEESVKAEPNFPTAWRNLALAYYNKKKDAEKAKKAMEKAFALDNTDVRVFLELDQLYKKLGWSAGQRLQNYKEHKEFIEDRDDLYIEYITLVNLSGNYKEAYQNIMGHQFHPWEGGEGKVTTQYTLALLGMAKEALLKEEWIEAEKLLREALVYPENLGEGKLEGTKDNHIYYYLGIALEAQGKNKEAKACFETATIGTDEPAGVMYYNDQPADMILYQGLAYKKLGKEKEAKSRFYRLIDYGERHLDDQVKVEYFAVSLPDFLIFNEDYTAKNKAHCYYVMALGYIGLEEKEKADKFLKQTVSIEPSHSMAQLYVNSQIIWNN